MKKAHGKSNGGHARRGAQRGHASADSASASHDVLSLQQLAGNQAVASLLTSGGDPLAPGTRADMESSFGHDFGDVRVHAGPDAEATALAYRARALTIGSHVWLGPGASLGDSALLGHELAHVVQQRGAPAPASTPEINANSGLESQAQHAGAVAARGGPASIAARASSGVQRDELEPAVKVEIPGFMRRDASEADTASAKQIAPRLEEWDALVELRIQLSLTEQSESTTEDAAVEYDGPIPQSLDYPIDADDLTGPELLEEVEALALWIYNTESIDPFELDRLLVDYQYLSDELRKRLVALQIAESTPTRIAQYQREHPIALRIFELFAPPGLSPSMHAQAMAFSAGFVGTLMWKVAPNDIERTFADTDTLAFAAGVNAGIWAGMVKQLGDNIVGLGWLMILPMYMAGQNLNTGITEARELYQKGWTQYSADQKAEAEKNLDLAIGVMKFAYLLQTDPGFKTEVAGVLGSMVGEALAEEFAATAEMKPFDKGWRVGELEGRIILEILLSLIPGQKVIAGITKSRWLAKSGELLNVVRRIAKNIPELAKYLDDVPGPAAGQLGDTGKVLDDAPGLVGESKHLDEGVPDKKPAASDAAPAEQPPKVEQTPRPADAVDTRAQATDVAEPTPAPRANADPAPPPPEVVEPAPAPKPAHADATPVDTTPAASRDVDVPAGVRTDAIDASAAARGDTPPVAVAPEAGQARPPERRIARPEGEEKKGGGPFTAKWIKGLRRDIGLDRPALPENAPRKDLGPMRRGSEPRGTMTQTPSGKRPRAAKKSDPEVGTIQRHRRRPDALTPEQYNESVRLSRILRRHTKNLVGKDADRTVAVAGDRITISGHGTREGFAPVDPGDVRTHGGEIGHEFTPHAYDPKKPKGKGAAEPAPSAEAAPDEPGGPLYHEVHAEKKAALVAEGEQIAVSKPMCPDCQRFFGKQAEKLKADQIVTDPDCTRVFHPDGTVTTIYPDGYAFRSEPPIRIKDEE